MEFRCPKCGSAFFATVSPVDRPVLKRRCKGSWLRAKDYAGCDFTWESTDDHKYGLTPPETKCTTE